MSCSTTSSSNTTQQSGGGPVGTAPAAAGPSTWLDGLHSPLIQEDGGDKKLKLRFDVSQYAPEEIIVKTVDNKLLVSGQNRREMDRESVRAAAGRRKAFFFRSLLWDA